MRERKQPEAEVDRVGPTPHPATEPLAGRQALAREYDLLQLHRTIGNRAVTHLLSQSAEEEGQPLDSGVRGFMEQRFGENFSEVRVHSGPRSGLASDDLGAAAWTFGRHVFFGHSASAPNSAAGMPLLAHELAHVVQQRRGGSPTGNAGEAGLEQAAGHASSSLAHGAARVSVRGASAPGIARQKKGGTTPVATVNTYRFTHDGQTITLTEQQYKLEVARTAHSLGIEFRRVEDTAAIHRETHKDFIKNIHGEVGEISFRGLVGAASDILGKTVPPHIGIWSWPNSAIANGREALNAGRVESAGRQLRLAQQALRDAQREWNTYIDKTTAGAERAKSYLETTRDISFAIAIGTAAVVAAPLIAGGLAAGGVTGAAGTITTGLAVTEGGAAAGALLRGGSSVAGQALAGDKVNLSEVKREAIEGAKRGAVDAGTAVVTLGAGTALGESASIGGRVVKGALAGGAGGGVGGGLEATLEGKSPEEVAVAAGKGLLAGSVGGGVGAGFAGSAAKQDAGRRLISGAVGGGAASATGAMLAGGSAQDIKHAALTGTVTGLVTSAGSHPAAKSRPPAPEGGEVVPIGAARRRIGPSTELKPGVREVTSLDEFRQRVQKGSGPPPTEPQSQLKPAVADQAEPVKLAAGAERSTPTAGPTTIRRNEGPVASGSRKGRGFELPEIGEPRRSTLREITEGPSTLSEHLEELGQTTETSDPAEKHLPKEAGKAIERPEAQAWTQELGGTHEVIPNSKFPAWLRKIFPARGAAIAGPDLVAIDEGSKTILVGDVTSAPNVDHIEKTIEYGRRVADALPADLKDYRVVAQERYWGHETGKSRVFVIKPRTGKP